MSRDATTIVWFRRDLRLHDHPPLAEAAARGKVVCVFVMDPELLRRRHHQSPGRLAFLRTGLRGLDELMVKRGGAGLVVRHGDPAVVLPALAREVGADAVHATREISPYGRARDQRVDEALAAMDVPLRLFDCDLLVPPEALPGPGGNGYRVFTPFYRAWLRAQRVPDEIPAPDYESVEVPTDTLDPLPDASPPVACGLPVAHRLLEEFEMIGVRYYREERDLLGDDSTSHLSPYLRFGMLTTGQLARTIGLPDPLDRGPEAWWRQIAWREFYHHLLYHRPEAARQSLVPEYRDIRWDNDPQMIDAWRTGKTGFPLVDAAMRQLVNRGWVHNRARMVAASFLVKDLLVDWRIGERIFMEYLVDGDPACNNGGWQWIASTGTEAAPYFRILNPHRQGRKFDPDGVYIRKHVDELRRVPEKFVHEPWTMDLDMQKDSKCVIGKDYPEPIVDHLERQRICLSRYREATGDPRASPDSRR